MDSFPSFFHGEPDGFPPQLRDRVFMDRLRSERPDLFSRLRERFPQMFSPSPSPNVNPSTYRDIPIQHQSNGSSTIPNSSTPLHFKQMNEHNVQPEKDENKFYHQYHPADSANSANTNEHQPRVYNIPIKVEGRENSDNPNPTPAAQSHPKSEHQQQQHASSPQPHQQEPHQQEVHQSSPQANRYPMNQTSPPPPPSYPHPPTPPSHVKAAGNGQVRSIPIQVVKSGSGTNTSGASPQVVNLKPVNQQSATNTVSQSESDPVLADPNTVIPLGYTELAKPQPKSEAEKPQTEPNVEPKKIEEVKQEKAAETPFDHVKEILNDLENYKSQVNQFNGINNEDKGYKWLDEMLTLCILRLDCIDINGNDELRKYRKDAINQVNQVFAILEAKVAKGKVDDDKTVETSPPTNNVVVEDSKESKKSEEPTKDASSKTPETKSKKIKIKKKKDEEGTAAGEETEKKKFFTFGKSKNNKKKASENLDPNNNVKAEDEQSTASDTTAGSESTTSSTTTLQGRETTV